MSCFGEGFEYEVPFAWFGLTGNESRPLILAARARWMNRPTTVNVHPNIQGGGVASLEAHFDEAPAIGLTSGNCGPCLRSVDQRHPPKLANVCQSREGVRAITGAWWCENLENSEEDFDGDFVDGTTFGGR